MEEVERLKQENDKLNSENGVVLLDTLEIVEDEPYDDFLVGYFKPTTDEVELLSEMKDVDENKVNDVINNRRRYFALRLLQMKDIV